jgi:hypothetical protein
MVFWEKTVASDLNLRLGGGLPTRIPLFFLIATLRWEKAIWQLKSDKNHKPKYIPLFWFKIKI